MKHSMKFQQIKTWYDNGHWTLKMVSDAVKFRWITEVEFEEITKKIYVD